MSRPGSVVLALLLLVPCLSGGRSPAQPTSTPVVTTAAAAPAAAIAVTVDSTGAREAIAGVTDVSVDASASTGSALRHRIELGDGAASTERTARHTYTTAGTYKIAVTVTDDAGRSAAAASDVVVASPLGRWVHAGSLARANRVGVWALTITAQDGTTVRGVLTEDNADRGTVTGSIATDRRVRFVLDRSGESLDGVIPSAFAAEGAGLGLTMRGGSSSGEALTFERVVGEPTGPPPDAVLKMRFFSFGAPFAVKQISPVLFDGSTSRGDGLSYFLEFGDGQTTTSASATHPLEEEGLYTARLTVVDRFGRSDVETNRYEAQSLVTKGYYVEWSALPTAGCSHCRGYLVFDHQQGKAVDGHFQLGANEGEAVDHFAGSIDGSGEVNLAATSGARLVGTLILPVANRGDRRNQLMLTWVGP